MGLKKQLKKALKAAKGEASLADLAKSLDKDEATLLDFIQKSGGKFTHAKGKVTASKGADDSPNNSPSPKKRKAEGNDAAPAAATTTTTPAEPDSASSPSSPPAKKKKKEKKEKKSKKESPAPSSADPGAPSTDIAAWRTSNKIVVIPPSGSASPDPYQSFSSAPLPASLQSKFAEKGFTRPSPIQAQCWPVMLAGDDIVGIAETGSGKTLAFAVPFLSKMSGSKKKGGKEPLRMLVLAPTRELAQQSYEVLDDFGSAVGATSLVVFGGVPKHEQVRVLKRGVGCVVATPGRLKDLCNEGSCDLSGVDLLVLDEADRMLDMGFEQDVRYIISMCAAVGSRQTAMFSATWPAAIRDLASEFMREVTRVYVGFESITGSNGEGEVDDSLSANRRVSQTVEVIEDRARDARIRELLKKYHPKRDNRVLVFALYKKEAARLERMLNQSGWNCGSIHGDKSQADRTAALNNFKDKSQPLLVATDVAARGLDIPDVECVINYTFPLTIEDYVHRIGRTGRAGKTGISHTFFQPTDKSHAGELQQVMKQAGQPVPKELEAFGSTIKKKEHKLYGAFGPKGGPMKKATKIVFD
mmetsp:Transcript_21877/g.45681  ORF Transcript_21877/g.45681 Transcript_21877/m.45681 type:complete len:585 (-) Transcript_21877:21-1775(-)